MIIDVHAHIYPEKIAAKAAQTIGEFYNVPMRCGGTAQELLTRGDKAGIDKFVIHSVATTAKQVGAINRFVATSAASCSERFIGFCTLHPDCENLEKEVEDALSLGLIGLKLHPDFQEFLLDSPAAMRIYEIIEGRMPVLFHAGDVRTQYTKPFRIANVKRAFPKLDIIAAHFGGYSEWGNNAKELAQLGIYVDTCSSLFAIRPPFARMLIDVFGADHVLFGTDYPMWDSSEELERFLEIPMTPEEKEWMLHGNFERLMQRYQKQGGL